MSLLRYDFIAKLRMSIEIEKKFRLTEQQREDILARLPAIGAVLQDTDHEENTLYAGGRIEMGRSVLRVRRIGKAAILTYKERLPSASAIKHQRELETEIGDADALDAILQALGFVPAVIYEKRRMRWLLGEAEIVVDDLPFGLFMEIEADESSINEVERLLAIDGLEAEIETYPRLAVRYGTRRGDLIEARFEPKDS